MNCVLTAEEKIVAAELANHLGRQNMESDRAENRDKKNLVTSAVAIANIGECRLVVDPG